MKNYSQNELARRWDIIESFTITHNNSGKPSRWPVFVRLEHLMRRHFWPKWDYAQLVIFNNPLKIARTANRITLTLDLRNERFGIYNPTGKNFLMRQYRDRNPTLRKICYDTSETIHTNLLFASQERSTSALPLNISGIPFRWASGGFLPIASYRGRRWCVLYFRDVWPIGWNVANGGSESKDECENVYQTIAREFCEECILLKGEPIIETGLPVTPYTFAYQSAAVGQRPLLSPDFAQRHWQMRNEHDGIVVGPNHPNKTVHWKTTPFQIETLYHRPGLRTTQVSTLVENVIFTVNPVEFGIEVVWVCELNLEENDYRLDGECHRGYECLVRRPVALIDLTWLGTIYSQENSLGELLQDESHPDCKRLPSIPGNGIRIFDKDIELRYRRLNHLKSLPHHTESQQKEIDLISQWLMRYEHVFKDAKLAEGKSSQSVRNTELRTLCPVTWKSLELLFAHNAIN